MKIKKIFIGFLVLFMFVFSSQVFAVGTISVSTKGPMLASVGASDHSIVSQENNKIVISFSLLSQGEVQTGVKYGVKLIKETDKSQFLVDEKVYDESLTLISGTKLKKEITYIAPSNIDGEYSLLLTVRNESGLIFGVSYVGKVEITSSTKGIVINPESCRLSIPGEKNKYIRYNLMEGVDISASESLQLHCTALNTDSKDITATPSFETHYRTVYGEIVPHTDVDTTPITFNAGEKKDISILLPKALKPQAYDVKVSLDYGSEKSNTIIAHYVIQGVSATIQNLSLDKDFYEKGETAKMFFSWSQSADGFPGSRLGKASVMPEVYINAKITNNYGLNCIDPIKQLLSVDHNTLKNDIEASINRTCVDPKISITLVDKDGNILDQKDFNVETSTREKEPIGINIIIALIILALIIVLTLVYIKNKKGKNPENPAGPINIPVAMFILWFTLISVGINFPVFKTDAQDIMMAINGDGSGSSGGTTVTSDTTTSTGTAPDGLAATLSLDKTSYDPLSTAKVTTSMYYTGCENVTKDLVATGNITGNGYTGPTVNLFDTTIYGLVGNEKISDIIAPLNPGDYTLNMKIKGYTPVVYAAYDNIIVTDEFGPSNSNSVVVSGSNFELFKEGVLNYWSGNYPGELTTALSNSLISATNITEVNSILFNNTASVMTASKSGGELSFTRDYSIFPFQVRGVNVTVNDSESPTIQYGGSAEVKWTAINPTYGCKCTFSPAVNGSNFCGLSAPSSENNVFGSNTVDGVSANTTFNVSCTDVEQTQ